MSQFIKTFDPASLTNKWGLVGVTQNLITENGRVVLQGTLYTPVDDETAKILDAALPVIQPGVVAAKGIINGIIDDGKFTGSTTLQGTDANGVSFTLTVQRK